MGFAASLLLQSALLFFIKSKMSTTLAGDNRKVTVKTRMTSGENAGQEIEEKVTYLEHDLREVKQALQQVVVQACIISFLHYKWKYTQPLALTSVLGFVTLCSGQLFKAHILGMSCESGDMMRPWKKPNANPFAAVGEQWEQAKKEMAEADGQPKINADSGKKKGKKGR